MKNIAIIGIIIIIALIAVRLLSPEDNWVCEKGKWVAHGNPASEKPADPCQSLFR